MKSTHFFDRSVSIAPLVTFRVLFGFIMACSVARFFLKGWIRELYIEPTYFFTFSGFGWIKPLGALGMYALFALMFLSAISIMVGFRYRIATTLFFISFTYVELIDKTNYLNHYYFVSLMAFLLIFLPANRRFSIDVWKRPQIYADHVPLWTISLIKAQLIIVYFFAGLAKLNCDWMIQAMPMKLWLPSLTHIPLVGSIFNYEETAYVFSWAGAAFDLSIGFLLLLPATRSLAYFAVVVFHTLTALLFPIGMFPYIMMLSTIIFFPSHLHEKCLAFFQKPLRKMPLINTSKSKGQATSRWVQYAIGFYLLAQIIIPLRYLMYPGSVSWSEQGYRFSWRVMLMEKAGHTTFKIVDQQGDKVEWATNYRHLTPQQEKMMSTQPDMILQFAHYLRDYYQERGFSKPQVYCNSKVTLNGRHSQPFIDPAVDLGDVKKTFPPMEWILPLEDSRRW
ncbi:MAG: HTTM domain-containing protein [Saprospiraceae bacterium]|nr:HTTM domain-containing protein [Saprospiraceae bacterium]